jgi:hypothetical protein
MNFDKLPTALPAEEVPGGVAENAERDYMQEVGNLPKGFEKTIHVGNVSFKFWRPDSSTGEDSPDAIQRTTIMVSSVHELARTTEGKVGPSGWTDAKALDSVHNINDFVKKTVEEWGQWAEQREHNP